MDRIRKKIKTVIIDDEPIARRNLRVLLEHDSDVEIVGEGGSGLEAIRLTRTKSPDLIFLDIQMPEMNGFEALERLGADSVAAIIFVTAFDQYALRAFEVHALDYLLKPFDDAQVRGGARSRKVADRTARSQRVEQKTFCPARRPCPGLRTIPKWRNINPS